MSEVRSEDFETLPLPKDATATSDAMLGEAFCFGLAEFTPVAFCSCQVGGRLCK